MASVTLTRVWLHNADDYADHVTLRARGIEATPERDVSRRVYAQGRVRSIARPAKLRTVSFEAIQAPRVDLDWIDDRLGHQLMFRDPRGRALWGFVSELPTTEHLWTEKVTLGLTFRAITGSAEV